MSAVLGIDAAWTYGHPSGVALVRPVGSGKWEAVAVDESYQAFLKRFDPRLAEDTASRTRQPRKLPIRELVNAARALAGTHVTLVAADIPLAAEPIAGRRRADNMVSEQFGEMGCSTHSPSLDRPGHLSEEIRDGFRECGFELATAAVRFPSRALIETFTHPALLSLMNASYRIPYKVGKTKCYWPNAVREERLVKVREQLERIWRALSKHIDKLDFSIPDTAESFSALKPLEDKIDALVCAWVGIKVLEGHAVAIGDDNAAIWLPRPNDWSELFATDAAASSQFMEGVEDLPVQERAIFAPDADLPLRARRTVAVNRSR